MKTQLLLALAAAWLPLLPVVAQETTQATFSLKFPPLQPVKLRYGLTAGGQASRFASSYSLYSPKNIFDKWLVSGRGGLLLDASAGWLAVQSGLLYTQRGYRHHRNLTGPWYPPGYPPIDFNGDELRRIRLHCLELPLNGIVTINHFQVLAGPYVAWTMSGRYYDMAYVDTSLPAPDHSTPPYTHEYEGKIYFGTPTFNRSESFRRLDVGYNVGVGYQRGTWQTQLVYTHSLRNVIEYFQASGWPNTYNTGWHLTGAYFFNHP